MNCSWDAPGANPYQGAPHTAVYAYADIPKPIQDRLSERMSKLQYDDVAVISRTDIQGASQYTDLRYMHFGMGKVCKTVTRNGWRPGATEVGLIYCEEEHCLIVPTVCRNVSRVTRVSKREFPAPTAPGGGSGIYAAPGAGSGAGWATPNYSAVGDQSPVTFKQASMVPYQTWWQPTVVVWSPGWGGGDWWVAPPVNPIYPLPPAPPVPEPASYLLALVGLGVVLMARKKEKK